MASPCVDRLPLVVGVTGHRDLRDEDKPVLENAVAGVITQLRRDFLDDDQQTPLIVLSALAEGADRLVARMALAQGAQLIAPMPMPLEEYRRDFEPGLTPGNITEFDDLLRKAIAVPVMPLQSSLHELGTDADKRAAQYRAVGIFIVEHCHVLLALWDGDEKDMAAGGAAEVVTFKRDGIPLALSGSPRASLDGSEIGPVIDILTPRLKQTHSTEFAVRPWGKDRIKIYRGGLPHRAWRAAVVFTAHLFRREVADRRFELSAADRRQLESWKKFEALIALNHEFNRDVARLERPDETGPLAKGLDSLFGGQQGNDTGSLDPKQHAKEVAPLWCRFHGIADALARERQTEFRRDWKWLFMGGLIAFVCFTLFTDAVFTAGVYTTTALLVIYIFCFIAMLIVFVRAVRRRHQQRYLDYRAFAEALRVAVFWRILSRGARDTPVAAIADAYPIQQPSELAWVKAGLRTLELLEPPQIGASSSIDQTGHAIARQSWVYGQCEWYRRQGVRHSERAEWTEAHSTLLLVLSIFLVAPLLSYVLLSAHEDEWLIRALSLLLGLLPGIAAALAGYAERLAFKAQARQYDRMRMLFERAYGLLPQDINETTMPLVGSLYRELGIEAMKENAELVAIYRQRPLRPVQ